MSTATFKIEYAFETFGFDKAVVIPEFFNEPIIIDRECHETFCDGNLSISDWTFIELNGNYEILAVATKLEEFLPKPFEKTVHDDLDET